MVTMVHMSASRTFPATVEEAFDRLLPMSLEALFTRWWGPIPPSGARSRPGPGAPPWMLFPPALAAVTDGPQLAASRAPSPLLVQYLLDDALFSVAGMRAAHEQLRQVYRHAGAEGAYIGDFRPGPHRFDVPMQEAAFDRLEEWPAER